MGNDQIRRMMWKTFRERFPNKYFPQVEKSKKEREFLELTQKKMTVREYTTQFKRLS